MSQLEGVDYSWARPGGAALKAAGKHFAVRYIPYPGSAGKGLDVSELHDLTSEGIETPMVYESYANRALEGAAAGKADAQTAQGTLAPLGLPTGMPIYFAVDFDATEAQQTAIDDYLKGAASVLGADRVGVYAGYWIVKRCHDNGSAKWFWQTYAWSGGQQHPANHLYQYENGQNINGAVDLVRALQDNYGQPSQFGGAKPVDPAPAPVESGTPAATYTVKSGDTLSGIASKYGTTYQELAAINGIANPSLIYPGQLLRLTGGVVVTAPSNPDASETYTVVSGDTLSSIAARHNTTYQYLASVNNISDPNKIFPGQVLKVPGSGVASTTEATYTVVSGDTLSGIASAHNTTWQALASKNGLANANLIYPGQVLKI